jgi:hypothetical protein
MQQKSWQESEQGQLMRVHQCKTRYGAGINSIGAGWH